MVYRVYLLRLQTITTGDQFSRGAATMSADRIGKVFVALAQDVRKCLICDGVFTRTAAEHAGVVCYFPDPDRSPKE